MCSARGSAIMGRQLGAPMKRAVFFALVCGTLCFSATLAAPGTPASGQSGPTSPATPSAAPADVKQTARSASGPDVVILLIDNSRSVPHMDPEMDRVSVLKEIVAHLKGFETRIILFGGLQEIYRDQPGLFRNDGLHTDYAGAFTEAVRVRNEYPPERNVRIVLVTDGIHDPGKDDYPQHHFTVDEQARAFAQEEAFAILEKAQVPVYFILLGEEGDMDLIQSMSIKANGYARANPFVESAASFLGNNGALFRKFVYVHKPAEGIVGMKKILNQVVSENRPYLEIILISIPVLLVLVVMALILRRFPVTGDVELLNLNEGDQVYIGVDPDSPAFLTNPSQAGRRRGLVCVSNASTASAGIGLQKRAFDFSPRGLAGLEKLDPVTRKLLNEDVTKLSDRLKQMSEHGSDEEAVIATDLHYYCSNLDPERIRTILQARGMDRLDIDCREFLHAKVYVSIAPDILKDFEDYRVFVTIPGRNIVKAQVEKGQKYFIGPYGMKVLEATVDSKYTARVALEYASVPSLFGLKKIVPACVQRVLRCRRSQKYMFTP